MPNTSNGCDASGFDTRKAWSRFWDDQAVPLALGGFTADLEARNDLQVC